ncbi:hypothetical protein L1987_03055 [Smallanthus sonchifolius]|uniref:Uncharacterized protein n=1 Tax=Smallanthus sonchifolius TaxID=185202 RepID=A0ACB9K9P1_9ASTR|nr:hypothetical protein L1987_03055 [Smallanthus sonchifolius]
MRRKSLLMYPLASTTKLIVSAAEEMGLKFQTLAGFDRTWEDDRVVVEEEKEKEEDCEDRYRDKLPRSVTFRG